jgi:hypothetical protein
MKKEEYIVYQGSPMNRDKFNQLPRFFQHLIAQINAIKPEKRTRDKETEAKITRCRRKTLGYEGDTQDDFYWSDHRDYFDEIRKSQIANKK